MHFKNKIMIYQNINSWVFWNKAIVLDQVHIYSQSFADACTPSYTNNQKNMVHKQVIIITLFCLVRSIFSQAI